MNSFKQIPLLQRQKHFLLSILRYLFFKDTIQKLKKVDVDEKTTASNCLRGEAQKGQGIGTATEVLHRALSDSNSTVRISTSWALSMFYFCMNDIASVELLIQKNNEDINYEGGTTAIDSCSKISLGKGRIDPLTPDGDL